MRPSLWKSVAVLVVLLAVPAAQAQSQPSAGVDEPLQGAAGEMAAALVRKKIKSVVVFDFSGPNDATTTFGQDLATSFSAALAKANGGFVVKSRSVIGQVLQLERAFPKLSAAPDFARAFAQDVDADAFVSGRLHDDAGTVTLTLSSYRADNGKAIEELHVRWPASAGIQKTLDASPIVPDSGPALEGYPKAGTKGYSLPQCLHCPYPHYPRSAMRKKQQGMVVLLAVIGTDGRVHHIHVELPLPYGLTAASVRRVQGWKLRPATDPDGKPAAVWEVIMLKFSMRRLF